MPSPALALLLADGRFPSGGHAHSNGIEQACDTEMITGLDDLEEYVRGRLLTSGVVAMHSAAGACHCALSSLTWLSAHLDAEMDARLTSPAARAVSRQQGAQLVRAASRVLPGPTLDELASRDRAPHLAVAQGVVAAAAQLGPGEAAALAGYSSVSSHCSAAVRLLGVDPFSVTRLVAALTPEIDGLAVEAARAVAGPGWSPSRIPALSSPLADLLGEIHHSRKERLFAS